jgi:hypothetical protein
MAEEPENPVVFFDITVGGKFSLIHFSPLFISVHNFGEIVGGDAA